MCPTIKSGIINLKNSSFCVFVIPGNGFKNVALRTYLLAFRVMGFAFIG
jgi:hypothetical protein